MEGVTWAEMKSQFELAKSGASYRASKERKRALVPEEEHGEHMVATGSGERGCDLVE